MAQQNDIFTVSGFNGSGTFTSMSTPPAVAACTQSNGAINGSCGALVNFLTDRPRTATPIPDLSKTIKHYVRDKVFGGYIQDDWRIRQGLTLNMGLRYEMQTNPVEKYGHVAYLKSLYGPSTDLTNQFYPRNVTLKNFEPRFGMAWDPFGDGKTSIRASAGLYDALPQPYIFQFYSVTTAPLLATLGTVGPPNTASPTAGTWPYSIPSLAINLAPQARTWGYIDQNIKRNYVYQYSLHIQRELGRDTTVTAGYSGSHAIHNPYLDEGNNSVLPVNVGHPIPGVGYYWPIPYTLGPNGAGNAALLNPNVGPIRSVQWQSRSYYNGLQLRFEKQLSHGFQAQASYTWSKSIDDSSGSTVSDSFTNEWPSPPWYDLKLTRGLSSFHVGHNLVMNGLWSVPTPKFFAAPVKQVLGDWQLGAIATVSDGVPLTPSIGMDGSDLLGEIYPTINTPQFLPSATCTSSRSLINPGNPNAYLNGACLGLVPQTAANTPYCDTDRAKAMGIPGTCPNIRGDLGRNAIIGPGLGTVDFSAVKNIIVRPISEQFRLQFRAEFFNALNRANFGLPTLSPNTGGGALQLISSTGQAVPGYGRISATQTPARQIQFALKAIW